MPKGFLRTILFMTLVLAFLIQVRIAEAKGPPDKVIITGPGLAAPIEITEMGQLQEFSIYSFEDIKFRVPEPKDPGQGYVIIRYPYDWLIYYPQPAGERGYVFYEGLLKPGMSSEFDGYWYRASETGDAAMSRILSAAGSADTPQASPPGAAFLSPVTVVMAAALLLVFGGAGIILARWWACHS